MIFVFYHNLQLQSLVLGTKLRQNIQTRWHCGRRDRTEIDRHTGRARGSDSDRRIESVNAPHRHAIARKVRHARANLVVLDVDVQVLAVEIVRERRG